MTIRERLLKIFKEADGEFVSGEELSRRLHCSRTAIWKHIEELRQEGYAFEAVRRSGYRLLYAPDRITPEEIKAHLQTKTFGKRIIYKESIDSTQLLAGQAAKEGAPEGTLVVADEQTGGKGRLGRSWHSPKGTGVWMSLIVRPAIVLQKAPQLTLLTSVAMTRAIRELTGLAAVIKWPNDIYLNGKKVCGILTELNAESDRVNYMIIGVGINVNTAQEDFPPELQKIATSLYAEGKRQVPRARLVQRFLEEMERLYHLYLLHGFAPIKEDWERYAISLGKYVRVRMLSGILEGWAKEIDADGALLLEDAAGRVTKVYSADIEIAES
ncbi:biotin--[acetyl-CoA-carboxylase] ligase [Bacillaceae bacterium]